MINAPQGFHRELKTEITGRIQGVILRSHLSLTIHGPGELGEAKEHDLFIAILQEALRDLQNEPPKEAP